MTSPAANTLWMLVCGVAMGCRTELDYNHFPACWPSRRAPCLGWRPMATKSPAMSSVSILSLCCVSRRRRPVTLHLIAGRLPSVRCAENDIAFDFYPSGAYEDFFSAETVTAMDKVQSSEAPMLGQIKRFFNRGCRRRSSPLLTRRRNRRRLRRRKRRALLKASSDGSPR